MATHGQARMRRIGDSRLPCAVISAERLARPRCVNRRNGRGFEGFEWVEGIYPSSPWKPANVPQVRLLPAEMMVVDHHLCYRPERVEIHRVPRPK